jgi:hypothetical protein
MRNYRAELGYGATLDEAEQATHRAMDAYRKRKVELHDLIAEIAAAVGVVTVSLDVKPTADDLLRCQHLMIEAAGSATAAAYLFALGYAGVTREQGGK